MRKRSSKPRRLPIFVGGLSKNGITNMAERYDSIYVGLLRIESDGFVHLVRPYKILRSPYYKADDEGNIGLYIMYKKEWCQVMEYEGQLCIWWTK